MIVLRPHHLDCDRRPEKNPNFVTTCTCAALAERSAGGSASAGAVSSMEPGVSGGSIDLLKADAGHWQVKEGDHVIYTDQFGVDRRAVVTRVWGQCGEDGKQLDPLPAPPSLNVVFVSGDERRVDEYGRQIERMTSVVWKGSQPAPGMSWRLP